MASTLRDTDYGSDSASGTVTSTAFGLNWSSNELVVAVVKSEGASGATITVDTGASTPTFTQLGSTITHANNDLNTSMFYWKATSSATGGAVRATWSASRPFRYIHAYTFTPTSGYELVVDGALTSATGTSGTPSAGSATPNSVGGVAVTGFGCYSTVTLTAGSGWTKDGGFVDGALVSEYRIVPASSGSITGNGTFAAVEWVALMGMFKEQALPAPSYTWPIVGAIFRDALHGAAKWRRRFWNMSPGGVLIPT